MKNGIYLFIRILEACNADCFMCGFARSKDAYRFGLSDLEEILPRIREEGVSYVRFTGGEPLMHKEIIPMIQVLTAHGIKSSIITNGHLLAKKAADLGEAGLSQVIVSIDGLSSTHDKIRGTPGLYTRALDGIRAAHNLGIMVRVNSVVGPDNFREMPELQRIFTSEGVKQWEMSSLKLGQKLDYKPSDREEIENVILPAMFNDAVRNGLLIPFGKKWCGDTQVERDLYFSTGITPRADNTCGLVGYVRYLDPKNGRMYVCSLIPHREESERLYPAIISSNSDISVCSQSVANQEEFFRHHGPKSCTGCSTTAAGFSALVNTGQKLAEWAF